MTIRLERWLQGPRGRCFVALAASVRNGTIAWEYARPMDNRRREIQAALLHALESVDPGTLLELSDRDIALALSHSVQWAYYWQEPWHDRVLGRSVFDDVLARLAAPLDAHPATQGWSDPIDLANQRHVEWTGLPKAALEGFAEIIAEDHRHEIATERRPPPSDPRANWSGRWTSIPPWNLPVTSPATPFAGARLLMVAEDGPPAATAIVRPVTVLAPVRVLEIRTAEDFAHLVASAPLDVPLTRRHTWYRATGEVHHWCIPDWTRVSQHYDAIHVTIDAYLETAGRVLPIAGGATVMAGWEPDVTFWLGERITLGEPPRRWSMESGNLEGLRWYLADDATR